VDHNRHAIVMEKIDGVELSRTKLEDEQVVPILDLILSEMADAYANGYVHADMSEYNVFVNNEGITIFDWPQAVETDHENADEFLERDADNVVGYFRRKYPQLVPENVDSEALAGDIADGAFETVRGYGSEDQ
jgi:RIO kinase 2